MSWAVNRLYSIFFTARNSCRQRSKYCVFLPIDTNEVSLQIVLHVQTRIAPRLFFLLSLCFVYGLHPGWNIACGHILNCCFICRGSNLNSLFCFPFVWNQGAWSTWEGYVPTQRATLVPGPRSLTSTSSRRYYQPRSFLSKLSTWCHFIYDPYFSNISLYFIL